MPRSWFGSASAGRTIHLGFLGFRLFGFKNPRFCVLDFLGFPWILSSELSLFNGLRGKNCENFSSRFSPCMSPTERQPAVEAMRKGGIGHGVSLSYFLISCNKLAASL